MLECPSDPNLLAAGFGNSLVLFALGCLSIMGFKQKTARAAAPPPVRSAAMQSVPHKLRDNLSSLRATVVTTQLSLLCNLLVVPVWCSDYPAAPPAAGNKAINGTANGQTVV